MGISIQTGIPNRRQYHHQTQFPVQEARRLLHSGVELIKALVVWRRAEARDDPQALERIVGGIDEQLLSLRPEAGESSLELRRKLLRLENILSRPELAPCLTERMILQELLADFEAVLEVL
jgi:hypothetical protein